MKKTIHIMGLLFIQTVMVACPATITPSIAPSITPQKMLEASPPIVSPTVSSTSSPLITYGEVFKITYSSCLPCHNRHTLPQIIERVKTASFSDIDGETRLRILMELEGLKALMDSSTPLSFSSGQTELMQMFNAFPGALYTMLEKSVMPPPWAPELMQNIDWPNYERLSVENRTKLLRFSKPYSEKYLYQGIEPISPEPIQMETPLLNSPEDTALIAEANLHFEPLSIKSVVEDPRVTLGKMLYHDPRLSKSGVISCNTCHNLASYGVDNRSVSIGHGFQRGARNAPTVFNASLNKTQFWDGRAKDLATQAEQPILNPLEMAMPNEASVIKRLESIPEYVQAFQSAYSEEEDALNYKNMARAIARFEETLVTPSRFDRFLTGDRTMLSALEKKGLKKFINSGCITCHDGPALGGGSYRLFGVTSPYQENSDQGRFDVTGAAIDRFVFKVPTLRNVAKTYPYFHDGKIWDLKEAVQIMGKTELGKEFSDQEIKELIAFLESLTGEIPESAKTLPLLPASGLETSQPEN